MWIKLRTNQRGHLPGSLNKVVSIVPHGGNYDCAFQYVLADGTHVPSDKAILMPPTTG